MTKCYLDENKNYQFNFDEAKNVFELHEIAQKVRLNDVDFIIETEVEFIFLEYKNATHHTVSRPDALRDKVKEPNSRERFCENIAKKFNDSLMMIWAMKANESDKQVKYVLLIEHPEIDGKIRRMLRKQIAKKLPFMYYNYFAITELLLI